jgi:methylmalonyl-CoA mutase
MRRNYQSTGVEVIHLGHDRSVDKVVNTAIQEDTKYSTLTSYQGGHNEYFKYMYDLLNEKEQLTSRFFGGGGRVIWKSLNYKTTESHEYMHQMMVARGIARNDK